MAWFTARLLRVPKNLPHLSRILICCGGVHLHSRLQALKLEASRPDAPPLIRKSKLQSFFAKSKNADYPQDFCSFLDSCPSCTTEILLVAYFSNQSQPITPLTLLKGFCSTMASKKLARKIPGRTRSRQEASILSSETMSPARP